MKRSLLRDGVPVVIPGKDFFSRKAVVTLENAAIPGWYARIQGQDVPINPRTLKYDLRRVVLKDGKRSLHVIEHLLALRILLNLDAIRIVSNSGWIPYGDSSARIFFDSLQQNMRVIGGLRHFTVRDSITVSDPTGKSWITYAPGSADKLCIRVSINYPGLGEYARDFSFPGTKLEDIAYARTQGWPKQLWYGTWLLPGWWEHRQNAVWPHDDKPEVILDAYARHRALDLLGGLGGLCPNQGTLVGSIVTHCAGHALDMKLIQAADPLLVEAGVCAKVRE